MKRPHAVTSPAAETIASPRPNLLEMDGLSAMRLALSGGGAPNIGRTMNFKLAEVERGFAAFEGEPFEGLLNPLGLVHGGWALTLIDSATGCAAHTTLPAGVGYVTIETKVNFVRAIHPDSGLVRAEGRVVAEGRTIITADAKITDTRGKLLAHGTSTLMVLRNKS